MPVVADHILWSRFKNGDLDALTELYGEYAHSLYNYGLKIIPDEALVKDCIQEVFIHLIDKRETLFVSSRTHVYLFKSLRNKLFEESRSKSRKYQILNLMPKDDQAFESSAESRMIEFEERKKIQSEIKKAIKELPDRQQEVVFLKYTEGFSYEEIGELLQIDVASARTLVYRSLKNIKKSLGPNAFLLFYIF